MINHGSSKEQSSSFAKPEGVVYDTLPNRLVHFLEEH
jgi:hypothetical protein